MCQIQIMQLLLSSSSRNKFCSYQSLSDLHHLCHNDNHFAWQLRTGDASRDELLLFQIEFWFKLKRIVGILEPVGLLHSFGPFCRVEWIYWTIFGGCTELTADKFQPPSFFVLPSSFKGSCCFDWKSTIELQSYNWTHFWKENIIS